MTTRYNTKNKLKPLSIIIVMVISGCAIYAGKKLDDLYGKETTTDREVAHDSKEGEFFHLNVKPILDNRCVVCHGCYDAPCQLDLSSTAGIQRGANKQTIYNGARLFASTPSRLFEDAKTVEQWRERGFFSVLNDRTQQADINLDASVFYQLLKLKKDNPLPKTSILDNRIDLGLDRNQQCPTLYEQNHFLQTFSQWGMPYGLPELSKNEFTNLEDWLRSGAKMAKKSPLSHSYTNQIDKWESFLNGDTLKERLMARYVFEHWYLAHLYFDQLKNKEYFKLVRSKTPPGMPIERISTRRPYDNPGVKRVYYRFFREQGTVLAKTHLPYALNDRRMKWMTMLFLKSDYQVTHLPGYETQIAANPFLSFEAIPVYNRWRFILEESRFTIMNFIKGPVCRGQIALNVINDHFWVVFVDPKLSKQPDIEKFLSEQKHHLRLPSEELSNALPISTWIKYSKSHEEYLKAKSEFLKKFAHRKPVDIDLIWDGDGTNKNAALTIFRHFDSASVVHGLVGRSPKTAWLINYPLLERIHYLLVAGFDVYGNVGHQLTTRLYMDFLRMEGEFNFLALLPAKLRKNIRDQWYTDASEYSKSYIYGEHIDFIASTTIDYRTNNPKLELYQKIKQHLEPVLERRYDLQNNSLPPSMVNTLERLNDFQSKAASYLPQTAFLTIKAKNQSYYFTIIHNNAHSNITSLLREKNNRLYDKDNITVVNGFIGDYPGAFWHLDVENINKFVEKLMSLDSEKSYELFMNEFGVRRTDEQFWHKSDEILTAYHKLHRHDAGLLDYNRLENR